ncbi:MAG: c-type cytochrome [Chryseosolibacter sp.]
MTRETFPGIPFTLFIVVLSVLIFFGACKEKENQAVPLEEIAANEEVLAFMKTFDGRGALSDSSQATPPAEALAAFRYPDDIDLKLILSEPEISQPVFINFDDRGRLWVVQYNQYPYPRDLKVTSMDQHIRATFDKTPPPPGKGARGADKITFFEDTDQDGVYDKSTDAITGLNIATSVAIGRGHIWVLNPPYLLAYPDADDDGLPDGDPSVHLEGFGLEDTHAVANSLRWGPDGWLYGAQGSTCTANISSAVSRNVSFDGQAIWRYHPDSKVFEVFAEGGGNTFDVEIDEKGRIYSGDNGTSRGQYYKQGAYYVRNFGKHGALTNPYAFGFLNNMALKGDKVRFTHAFVKYEGGSLPARYDGHMIAINPLQSFVQLSRFETNGSTFRIVDEARILETDDNWFRPVDITIGPDGGVYIADWYDSRLSHVDPRDTWSKKNGRIYRLGNTSVVSKNAAFDISTLANEELVKLLSHSNRWFRQQALCEFGNRKDAAVIPSLIDLLGSDQGQLALEALWALNLSGGFDDKVAVMALRHADPFVRMWAVRLAGDTPKSLSHEFSNELARLSSAEEHPEVRSQLAATAKRLAAKDGMPIIRNLLAMHDDAGDPDLPLQLWWALESKAGSDPGAVVELFQDRTLWRKKLVANTLLQRLMQRLVLTGDSSGYAACARMIALAPSTKEVGLLFNGLQEGLRGTEIIHLPPALANAIKPYQKALGEHSLALALRQGDKNAVTKALDIIGKPDAPLAERITYVRIFGEMNEPQSIPVLLSLVESNQTSAALKQTALQSLQRYDDPEIGKRVVKAYPDKLRSDPGVRLAALSLLSTRPSWAIELLHAIDRKKQAGEKFIAHTIRREDVPDQIVRQLKLLEDPQVTGVATRLWPGVRFASGSEKTGRIKKVAEILGDGTGYPDQGRSIFLTTCAPCHRLHNEGGTLGPDLSGYDRRNVNDMIMNIVDPGAYVREGYVTYRVSTADGRVLTGTVSGQSGNTVSLNLSSGEKITLAEGEVQEMRAQPSMMPENLLDPLTDQQIRDLFAYLMKM